MGVIAWIVLGAIAGFLANRIVGGREGLIGKVVLGIVGGVVGGYVASQVFHHGNVDGLNVESILIAVAGAVVVLFLWRRVTSQSNRRLRL
jgi:uncharacterized membrane protein YeaQ/YmgE (transglycosylase-associated protein family)